MNALDYIVIAIMILLTFYCLESKQDIIIANQETIIEYQETLEVKVNAISRGELKTPLKLIGGG